MNDPSRTFDQNPPRMRRSQGQIIVARALWYTKPGQAELRTERLAAPAAAEARVATQYSAISRGTERLVAQGEVPQSEWQRMRAPMQVGAFSFPVKYGYSAAGLVTAGPENLINRRVFALHPHQDHFQVHSDHLTPIPDAVPSRRAVLAANMETALNAHWDAQTSIGDRVLVVGAGVVGLLVGYLAKRITGCAVTIADIDPSRAAEAGALGLEFSDAKSIPADHRIVFHTSATAAGLSTAIEACAFEGRVIELSWYGTRPITINLGGAFHARRLQLRSSQVGHIAPSHRSQVTHRARLTMALALLDDPALDRLLPDSVNFDELPEALPAIWSSSALPPVVCY